MDITKTGTEATIYIPFGEQVEGVQNIAEQIAGAVDVRVVIEAKAKATLLSGDTGKWVIEMGEESELLHIISPEDVSTEDTEQIFEVFQTKGSRYDSVRVTADHPKSVDNTIIHLGGEGAQCEVRGLYVGSGKRFHESDVTMRHEKPGCQSKSLFKGIAGDDSAALFRGMVYVADGASKTEAEQSFKSLLLSDKARIQTEPQLEIYNDDVVCSHGATVGQLDEVQLFYLESRGFDPITARKMLIESFAAEVVSLVPDESVRKMLLDRVHAQVLAVSN